MEYVKMNNGKECPVIGIGTYTISPADGGDCQAKQRYSLL